MTAEKANIKNERNDRFSLKLVISSGPYFERMKVYIGAASRKTLCDKLMLPFPSPAVDVKCFLSVVIVFTFDNAKLMVREN